MCRDKWLDRGYGDLLLNSTAFVMVWSNFGSLHYLNSVIKILINGSIGGDI